MKDHVFSIGDLRQGGESQNKAVERSSASRVVNDDGGCSRKPPPSGSASDSNKAASTYPMTNIQYPGIHDVLTGRGGHATCSPGNVKFRQMALSYKQRYLNSPNRRAKAEVVLEVLRLWRSLTPPGRFLSQFTQQKPSKSNTARKTRCNDDRPWNDIGDTAAKRKIAQSLRERDRLPADSLFLGPTQIPPPALTFAATQPAAASAPMPVASSSAAMATSMSVPVSCMSFAMPPQAQAMTLMQPQAPMGLFQPPPPPPHLPPIHPSAQQTMAVAQSIVQSLLNVPGLSGVGTQPRDTIVANSPADPNDATLPGLAERQSVPRPSSTAPEGSCTVVTDDTTKDASSSKGRSESKRRHKKRHRDKGEKETKHRSGKKKHRHKGTRPDKNAMSTNKRNTAGEASTDGLSVNRDIFEETSVLDGIPQADDLAVASLDYEDDAALEHFVESFDYWSDRSSEELDDSLSLLSFPLCR